MRALTSVLCVTVASMAMAHAEDAPDKKRGRVLWLEGIKLYDLGNFDDAIKAYEEAYRLWPSPQILNNLGQAERQRHNYERAIFYFRSYLRYTPNASNEQAIKDLIKELEDLAAAQKKSNEHPPDTVHNPPGATPPTPSQPSAVVAPTRWYQDPIGWTLAGAGLVAIGVGTGFIIHSNGLSDDAKTAPDQREAQSKLDSSQTFKIAGGVTLGVGAALVIGGVVKMVLHENRRRESLVSLAVGAGGIGLAGSF